MANKIGSPSRRAMTSRSPVHLTGDYANSHDGDHDALKNLHVIRIGHGAQTERMEGHARPHLTDLAFPPFDDLSGSNVGVLRV